MDKEAKDPHTWPETPATATSLEERRCAFGQKLKMMREAHSLSAQALAQTTRISYVFVEALESGALERLPGEVFGRGFVRSIAKNLGIDAAPLLAEFEGLWEKAPPRSVLKVEIKNKPVRQRSEHLQALLANSRSLVKRGAALKIALPVAAVGLLSWVLVSTPLRTALGRHPRGNMGAASAAKTLDLRPVPDSETPPAVTQVPTDKNGLPAGEAAAPEAAVAASASMQAGAAGTPEAATPEAAAGSAGAGNAAEVPPFVTGSANAAGAKTAGGTPAATPGAPGKGATKADVAAVFGATANPAAGAADAGQQVLELTVVEPVRIKIDVDHGPAVTKELTPDTYRFTFDDRANMMVYDAAAVKVSFNGRPLPPLGNKGRVRRLSFQARQPADKKL